jgi:hypothetical protein
VEYKKEVICLDGKSKDILWLGLCVLPLVANDKTVKTVVIIDHKDSVG